MNGNKIFIYIEIYRSFKLAKLQKHKCVQVPNKLFLIFIIFLCSIEIYFITNYWLIIPPIGWSGTRNMFTLSYCNTFDELVLLFYVLKYYNFYDFHQIL